jgi:hypothetical protein
VAEATSIDVVVIEVAGLAPSDDVASEDEEPEESNDAPGHRSPKGNRAADDVQPEARQ